ncbi:unnamed protein product [Caenorhabditis auriculariae]|uniref:Uncharacterized protein n=1 Tax=Caenorhabditis auriculariae TaxID=2777116 RepID=A0A8S1HU20_9PELO|nr:unnamed protein product [Caenorhabditis auriculariae]
MIRRFVHFVLNCSNFCFLKTLECDGLDTCGEDESRCDDKLTRRPLSSYSYGREALSSSELMLIGFFVLNGSFIVFFLILSLFSAGAVFGRFPLYARKSNASRNTFVRYLREAIPSTSNKPTEPPEEPEAVLERVEEEEAVPLEEKPIRKLSDSAARMRPRPSILSRINFDPAPALKELEPEVEDRDITPPESICSPPAHRPDVFLRRQSLPVTSMLNDVASSVLRSKRLSHCGKSMDQPNF